MFAEALQVRLSVAKHASLFRVSLIDLKKELFIELMARLSTSAIWGNNVNLKFA